MATKLLQLRPLPKPSFTHLYFSTSSSSSNDTPPPPSNETPPPPPTPKPFSFSSIANSIPQNPTSNSSSLESIRKNLAEFRRRTVGPTSPSSPPPHTPSFQELYHRNVNNVRPTPSEKIDLSAIRQSIQKFKNNNNNNNNNSNVSNNSMNSRGRMFDSFSLSRFKDSFKLRPDMENNNNNNNKGGGGGSGGMVIGGSETSLPISIFGKELMRDKEGFNNQGTRTAGEFVRFYTHGDLGEKLKKLRPGKKEEFSLKELNERLMKLREIDEEEIDSKPGGSMFQDLKGGLYALREKEIAKKNIIQRLDVLGQLGGTPSFMLHPPKEQLVEKYFHPDNMSSEEKMKLELQKVRDEYKMSESDCGSARVQVAQLTTKIKHLSTVLHKKDKHSRKGLQAMVVKRKKLLKYLRRTDWDSYCLVLSKLGLRDNPDYKF